MSYTRFSRHCDWYIFWQASDAAGPDEEILAIWHAGNRDLNPGFRCQKVRKMLERDDFSAIPGYTPAAADFLREVLTQFVQDVASDYSRRVG